MGVRTRATCTECLQHVQCRGILCPHTYPARGIVKMLPYGLCLTNRAFKAFHSDAFAPSSTGKVASSLLCASAHSHAFLTRFDCVYRRRGQQLAVRPTGLANAHWRVPPRALLLQHLRQWERRRPGALNWPPRLPWRCLHGHPDDLPQLARRPAAGGPIYIILHLGTILRSWLCFQLRYKFFWQDDLVDFSVNVLM